LRSLAIIALLLAVAATLASAADQANPGFPKYFAITPEHTPGIQGVPTDIDVRTFNYGNIDSNGVEVTLFFNDWGAIYSGWQPIGTETMDLVAGGNSLDTFTHTFEAAAHTCLKAEITDAGDGGNTDVNDDVIQINWDVVSADDAENIDLFIPFGNADGEEILINGTEIVCVNNSEIIPCNIAQSNGQRLRLALGDAADPTAGAPGQVGDTVMAGNSEVLTRLRIPAGYMTALDLDEFTVMVRTEMGPQEGPREQVHAMVTVLKTTVAEILNKPHLCCLKSVKMRVMLETIIADALNAYEAGDGQLALKLLRIFVQKAKLLECDLTDEEITCIQKAIQAMTDAGLMIAREFSAAASAAGRRNTNPGAVNFFKDFDRDSDAQWFRRAGLYEAALLTAAKGSEKWR